MFTWLPRNVYTWLLKYVPDLLLYKRTYHSPLVMCICSCVYTVMCICTCVYTVINDVYMFICIQGNVYMFICIHVIVYRHMSISLICFTMEKNCQQNAFSNMSILLPWWKRFTCAWVFCAVYLCLFCYSDNLVSNMSILLLCVTWHHLNQRKQSPF